MDLASFRLPTMHPLICKLTWFQTCDRRLPEERAPLQEGETVEAALRLLELHVHGLGRECK